jgi:plastocyanin
MFLFLFAGVAFGKDVYLSIGGEVGNFFTDARIFNPSFEKDIVISARYLQNNQNNSNVTPVTVNVPKRTMLVLDNVVSRVFNSGGIGAIRLTSDDDFVATQRIYARVETNKTLGQFVPGLDGSAALKKGALIQLKQNGGGGTAGTFRTNLGGANPNAVAANVTLKLYDKNNAVAVTKTFTFQPYGVLNPSNIATFFGGTFDLSDSWISFDSDQPLFLYVSVVDNGSDDPTFIPASPDSGNAPPPSTPEIKNVTVVASNWQFGVTGGQGLKAGDQVNFILSTTQDIHGFQLVSPGGEILIDFGQLPSTPTESLVTLAQPGTYFYYCTFSDCGAGHTTMNGEFVLGDKSPGGGPGY